MRSMKEYLTSRMIAFAIQCQGLTNRKKWSYVKRISPSFRIAPSKKSDFEFIYRQILEGEKTGAFNSAPDIESWKIKEGKRHQFLSTINFNVMRDDPHPIAQSFLMSARLSNRVIGFVWLKQLQGFPMDGWEVHIMCVDSGYRGRGVGKYLLACATDFISQTCGGDIFVRVKKAPGDEVMHRLLKGNKFQIVEEIQFHNGAKMYQLAV